MSKEFDKGRKVGRSWKLPEETPNPYEEGTIEYERWRRGFNVGCEEFNKRMEKQMGFR